MDKSKNHDFVAGAYYHLAKSFTVSRDYRVGIFDLPRKLLVFVMSISSVFGVVSISTSAICETFDRSEYLGEYCYDYYEGSVINLRNIFLAFLSLLIYFLVLKTLNVPFKQIPVTYFLSKEKLDLAIADAEKISSITDSEIASFNDLFRDLQSRKLEDSGGALLLDISIKAIHESLAKARKIHGIDLTK